MFDFIGDIHGHATKLKSLLDKLGYKMQGGVYQHPTRKAFFLGDLIDSGPQIQDVLNVVIPMVDNGAAKIVMGNHEFNFLSYNTPHPEKERFLRSRSENHTNQCIKTLEQVLGSDKDKLLNFIWQIPLWHEDEKFQAIHACWHEQSLNSFKTLNTFTHDRKLNKELLVESNEKDSQAYELIEILLKGIEVKNLPKELHFTDSYGKVRDTARVCWWNQDRKIIIPPKDIDETIVDKFKDEIPAPIVLVTKPTFFGHYWETGTPRIVNPRAVCLDYSVAKKGSLCAYRFDGEDELTSDKLVHV
jgi:hypothetical protein